MRYYNQTDQRLDFDLAGRRTAEPYGEVQPEIEDKYAYAVKLQGLPLSRDRAAGHEQESKDADRSRSDADPGSRQQTAAADDGTKSNPARDAQVDAVLELARARGVHGKELKQLREKLKSADDATLDQVKREFEQG